MKLGAWLVIAVMIAACDADVAEDEFWAETRDDDGTAALGALAGTKQVAIDPGTTDHAELVDLLPVGRSEGGTTRRIYSHRLKGAGEDLRAGEQFLVEAKLVTAVADRARISAQLVVSKRPDGTDNGVDKIAPGAISEQNGVNCTAGTSPCVTRKVAVFRVTDDIAGPVYVNVVAKSAVPGGGSTDVTVRRDDGWVRSVRYDALFAR